MSEENLKAEEDAALKEAEPVVLNDEALEKVSGGRGHGSGRKWN